MPWYELKSSKHPYFSPTKIKGLREIPEPGKTSGDDQQPKKKSK